MVNRQYRVQKQGIQMTTKTHQSSLIKTAQEKISMALSNQITPMAFIEWYENWYLGEVQNIENLLDKKMFLTLQELYSDIGYFEPNDEIRKTHHSYYGLDKFRKALQNTLSEIEK
jgi:hypothetical protein